MAAATHVVSSNARHILHTRVDQRRQAACNVLRECVGDNAPAVEHGAFVHAFQYDTLCALASQTSLNRQERVRLFHMVLQLFSQRSWITYHARVRAVMYNLCHSPHLQALRDANELNWHWLGAVAAHDDMWPERRPQPKWEVSTFTPSDEPEPEHSLYCCRRCHSRCITINQKQTRSADEAMTVFLTCRKCNNRWRD